MSSLSLDNEPARPAEIGLPEKLGALFVALSPALQRLIDLLILLFALTTLLFFLLRVAGDPALVLAGPDADPEQIAAIKAEYGLDQPLIVQYFSYMFQVVQFDLGTSLASGQSAIGEVMAHLPATLLMTLLAMAFTIVVSIAAGAWLGFRSYAPAQRTASWLVFILQGTPGFVAGLLLIQVFAVTLGWLPSIGHGLNMEFEWTGSFPFFATEGSIDYEHWLLPTLALAAFLAPKLTRVVAANVAEAMSQDYIRTARANGAGKTTILWKHALPNAMLATTALIGTQFAFLLSGTVIIEMLFSWPGMGWLLLKSTQTLDFPIVQATAIVIAVLVFAVNMVTDIMFGVLDPRIRTQKGSG